MNTLQTQVLCRFEGCSFFLFLLPFVGLLLPFVGLSITFCWLMSIVSITFCWLTSVFNILITVAFFVRVFVGQVIILLPIDNSVIILYNSIEVIKWLKKKKRPLN